MSPCYFPLSGWQSKTVNPSGKRSIVFNINEGFADRPQSVPCGQCIGCRLERSRQWAVRCVHESIFHENNCFLTLTYNDENLPAYKTLVKDDLTRFFKRLRKSLPDLHIRYYACGEYGSKNGRPHYHVILFGYDFPDKTIWKFNHSTRCMYYRSVQLEKLWPYGFSTIGNLTFESVAYTARYVMKKITGDRQLLHYVNRIPEYSVMSRRPGIGKDFFEKYSSDLYPKDYVTIRDGVKTKPPKYYDMLLQLTKPLLYETIKINRKKRALQFKNDNSIARLQVRHLVKSRALELLKRSYEDETVVHN